MNFIGKERFRSGISIFIFILILILSSFTVNAQESGVPEIAPINPDFISRNIERVNELNVEVLTTDGHGLGLIPSPLDLSHLKGQHASILGAPIVGYPTSYDLRTLGKVTPVRDQGNCGSCWSFATYGSMESILLLAETWDFSENNLKNTHGFDYGHCYGGDAYMSTAYLARWSGPILEADDPYNPNSNVSPTGLTTKKHLQETLIIPDRTNSLDNDNIKQAVMTYGGLYTTMYWNDSYYNLTNKAYYYNGSNYANHAVTIVGWDDNFDRTRFSPVPPGNGAFIIKNSWGTAWGENGYFYISYYDTIVGSGNTAFNSAEATANYSNVYQYDPLGWTSSIGYTGSNTAWFSNIFTATANEQLSAVSFYTASVNSSYEIYIYTGVTSTPTNGSLIGTKTGAISLPGYHTISFNPSVTLTSGQKFSVVVKLTTPGFNYPVPIEYPFAGYSSQATAGAGQSFVSSNGIGWSDITTFFTNTNVCVKAFIRTCTDNDGDGYGNPASASCAHPELDCNDSNTNIHPGATETCNNIDDDCDSSTDENLTRGTTCGVGQCSGNIGTETCTAGTWGGNTCNPLAGATTEICDGIDNDCDGSTDENLTHSTSCGVGACASTGTETCTAGVWGGNTCTPGTPSAEVCDNIDNDCDGQTDEGVLITWYADGDSDGYGYLNSSSTQACNAPAGYVANNTDCDDSNPAVNPGVTEISNNGIDDDCNPATPVITASGSGNNYPVTLFRASLSLNVNASSLGTSTFSYYYTRARLYLVSTSITGISVTGGVATITGAGKVNNVTGYTFTATITDSSTDKMGLEIRKSDGTLYYSATSKNLSSGNFTVIGQ